MITTLLEQLVQGMLLGGVFALVATGLNMIYGVMEIINFAHGEFIMLGMYISYWLFVLAGVHPLVSLLAAFPLLFLVGSSFEKIVIERVIKAHIFIQTFVTFGLLILLQNLAYFFWAADYRSVAVSFPPITMWDVHISTPHLIGFLGSVTIIGILHLFLTRTRLGVSIRAVDENPRAAELAGINVARIRMIVFGLGGSLAGVAGVFISLFYYIYPTVGFVFVLLAFVIVVLGGMGNFFGSLVGGLLIGEFQAVSSFFVGPQWKEVAAMLAFIAVLLVRPTGIFGMGERK